MNKIAFLIGVSNVSLLVMLAILLPTLGNNPDPTHPILAFFMIYYFFVSELTSLVGIVLGGIAVVRRERHSKKIVLLNFSYLLFYIFVFVVMMIGGQSV